MSNRTQDRSRPTFRFRPSPWWLVIGLLWAGFFIFTFRAFAYGAPERYDFRAYYVWTESMVKGGPLYDGIYGQIYLYPPLLAQLLAPFALLGNEPLTATGYYLVSAAALFATLWMLGKTIAPKWAKWLWVSPILLYPFLHATYIGQITIVLTALLTGAWLSVKEGHRQRAGWLIALAAWIKVYPGFLLIYFVVRRDWKVVQGIVVGGLALLAFQVLLGGLDLMLEYAEVLIDLFTLGQYSGGFQNLSIFGVASRMFQETRMTLVVSPLLYGITRYGLMGLMFGSLCFIAWRDSRIEGVEATGRRLDLSYGAFVVLALLSGSTLWTTGVVPAYLGYVLTFKHLRQRGLTLMVIASYAMLSIYHPMLIQYDGKQASNFLYSTGFFALMALWWVAVWMIRKPPAPTMPNGG